jgi:uncharacterized protein YndB with AHSA1/START domain
MARNETHVAAAPDAVWDVLMDAHSYAHWVVGSKEVREPDASWPQPGSRFHHTIGIGGPLTVKDHTEIEEISAPLSLVLLAKTRPWAVARVELYLKPEDDGTTLIMEERPVGGLVARAASVLLDPLIKARNTESLRRLKRLAERRDSS